MKFDLSELNSEMDNLDQTCSISVTYNRPPKTPLSEFTAVMDAIFSKRVTKLIINLSFLSPECHEYLLSKLPSAHTLKSLHVTYKKELFTIDLFEAIDGLSLSYLSIRY